MFCPTAQSGDLSNLNYGRGHCAPSKWAARGPRNRAAAYPKSGMTSPNCGYRWGIGS